MSLLLRLARHPLYTVFLAFYAGALVCRAERLSDWFFAAVMLTLAAVRSWFGQ